MNKLIFFFSVALLGGNTAHATSCVGPIDGSRHFGAAYQVTEQRSGQAAISGQVEIWWRPNEVIYHYPRNGAGKWWTRSGNLQLSLVQFFDKEKRSIEYQPNELKKAGQQNRWEEVNNLIGADRLARLKIIDSQGQGCTRVERRSGEWDGKHVELTWLPQRALVETLDIEHQGTHLTWELKRETQNSAVVDRAFDTRGNYVDTDYIDIGDNEADPFLRRMIKLGFVEHGHAGFYDEHGNSLGEARHQH